MFPSSGFFKGIICPYLSSGLCERPYCHYKHSGLNKSDEKRASAAALTGSDVASFSDVPKLPVPEASIAVELAGNSSSQAYQLPIRCPPSMLNMVGSAISKVQPKGCGEKFVQYRPTPKTATKATVPTTTVPVNSVLEYTPTPIHLLKQSKPKIDELEYDPVLNYSTKMRPLNSVRVTLADLERESVKRPAERTTDEAGVAKRRKMEEVGWDVEGKFSEDEDAGEEKPTKENAQNRNLKAEEKSSRSNSNDTSVSRIDAGLAPSDPVAVNGSPTAADNSKDGESEGKACTETGRLMDSGKSSNAGSLIISEVVDSMLVVGESSKNDSTEDLDAKKDRIRGKDMPKDDGSKEVLHHGRRSSEDKGRGKRDHLSSSKSLGNSEIINKENKSSSSRNMDSSHHHRHHHHRQHHHQNSQNHKSHSRDSKECVEVQKEHLKECSRHSEKERSTKHKEHSKHLVKGSGEGEKLIEQRHKVNSEEEKSRKGKNGSESVKENSDAVSSCKEKEGQAENRFQEERSFSAKEKVRNSSGVRDHGKGVEKTKSKDALSKDNRHRTLSRSVSELGKPQSEEKSVRRTSNEEVEKKHRTEQGSGDGNGSIHQNSSSNRLQSSTGSTLQSSTGSMKDFRSKLTKQSSSSLSIIKRRTTSNSSSSSSGKGKPGGSGVGCSRDVKRTISQVELFGEDSDTELQVSGGKQSDSFATPRYNLQRSDRSSRDTNSYESDASACDVALSDDLPEEELDNTASSRFEECHRLFTEANAKSKFAASQPAVAAKEIKAVQNVSDQSEPVGKKRIAHVSTNDQQVRRLPSGQKQFQPSAAKTMMDRYRELQKAMENKESSVNGQKTPEKVSVSASGCAGTASTASLKIKERVAHVPKSGDFLQKPILAVDSCSKIPVKVRQFCLDKIYHECSNIYDVAQDAKDRALAEEKAVYEKSATKSIYLNLISNAVRRLRDESPFGKSLSPKNPKALSHEAILGGSKAANTSFTVNRWGKPSPVPEVFSELELYRRLLAYVMSESDLVENSFPRTNPEKNEEVVIKKSQRDLQKEKSTDPNQKFCCRCGKAFVILPNGSFVREEECLYHWGHAWKQRVGGTFDNIYSCCGGDFSSRGCQVSECHVHDENKYQCLTGYMATMPPSPRDDGNYGVYAIDCEMVYTTFGCELARVTIIGANLDAILDKIVKPDHEVIDYNTRFSGLTEDDLRNVKTSLRDIQAILLHMFNSKTILIGHSLESDLTALKLVHGTVVDTSVVFPHRRGPPFKRALQNVVKETLQKIIQNNVGGHDSSEDARSCMELMLWKVKEDAKRLFRFT